MKLIKYVFQTKQKTNLSLFNMITGINELKTSTNHISCKCKYKFEDRKYNSNQKWNYDK